MKVTRGNFKVAAVNAEVALTNEEITRKRVDALEEWASRVSGALSKRGFWARLGRFFIGL